MNSDKLLFNYHDDAQVTEGDLILFRPPGWLNDRCINFYFRVLEHEEFKDRPDLLFMDPAVVSCMLIQCTGRYLGWDWEGRRKGGRTSGTGAELRGFEEQEMTVRGRNCHKFIISVKFFLFH